MTGLNRNQRNSRDGRRGHEFLGTLGQEKVRHAQERSEDRRSRKLDFEIQKKRVNNEYFVHERLGRRVRSSRSHRESKLGEIIDPSSKTSFRIEDHHSEVKIRSRSVREAKSEETLKNLVRPEKKIKTDENVKSSKEYKADRKIKSEERNRPDESSREFLPARNRKIEDFEVDMDDFAQARRFWTPGFDEKGIPSILQVQDDYFGEYIDEEDTYPKRRSSSRNDWFFTYEDLLRMKRDLEDEEYEETFERRVKRKEEDPRCNSDVTTLTVGCSTIDRMEFESDCVNDDAVTGTTSVSYSILE